MGDIFGIAQLLVDQPLSSRLSRKADGIRATLQRRHHLSLPIITHHLSPPINANQPSLPQIAMTQSHHA